MAIRRAERDLWKAQHTSRKPISLHPRRSDQASQRSSELTLYETSAGADLAKGPLFIEPEVDYERKRQCAHKRKCVVELGPFNKSGD